ncbi:12027_t:CDS:2, partial [Racocetra fulgida]
MAAVGILVSPTVETGLCGRPWKHLGFLQDEVVSRGLPTETGTSSYQAPVS